MISITERNNIASERCAAAWREWFKTPDGQQYLKDAKEAEVFLEKLEESLRTPR